MPVISSTKNADDLILTIVSELAANPDRVWELWSDPRQLERWWGPPTWPATFEKHDFVVGGLAGYYMTGPEGEKAGGWWRFLVIDQPSRLEIEDGFADENGEPDTSMGPATVVVTFEPVASGTRMSVISSFATVEIMNQMIEMGMQEGMGLAMGQIDALLVEQP